MGWNNGGAYRSATAMHELGRHMERLLPGQQWDAVRELFDLAQTARGPFKVSAADSRRIAEAFRKAAAHPKMPAFWAQSASELAAVAERHAAARKPWRWS